MRITFGHVCFCACLVACSSTLPPNTPVLSGAWNTIARDTSNTGGGTAVTANNSQVVITLSCMGFTFPGPVRLNSDGSFAATGTVSWQSGGKSGIPARLSGTITGDTLRLEWGYAELLNPGQWLSNQDTLVTGSGVLVYRSDFCVD